MNVDADESVGRCQLLLDTFTAIINLIGLVSVLRRSSLQEEGPDGAESENNASIRATIEQHLSQAHACLSEVLSDMRAQKLAAQCVAGRYFEGRKILFESTARALEITGEAAVLSAEKYQRLLDSPAAEPPCSVDAGKIDLKQIEAIAQDKAEKIVSGFVEYFLCHMRLSFGQSAQALEQLNLYLGEIVQPPLPSESHPMAGLKNLLSALQSRDMATNEDVKKE